MYCISVGDESSEQSDTDIDDYAEKAYMDLVWKACG
jgi:hypothetical protein